MSRFDIRGVGVCAGPAEPRLKTGTTHGLKTGARHSLKIGARQGLKTGARVALPSDAAVDAAETVRRLRLKLEAYHRRRARRAGWKRRFVPTGLAPLDAVLPQGGVPCGAVTEILTCGFGVGSMSLAMRIAQRTIQPDRDLSGVCGLEHDGRSIVFVDVSGDLYPPAAWHCGIALDRLIVLRVGSRKDAFWATDQSLRCPAVAAAIAPLQGLDDRLSRRLQLAAECSGSLGLILAPAHQRAKSFAAVRMLIEGVGADREAGVTPVSWSDSHLCRITLLTVRAGQVTEPLFVDLHHETGSWPVPPVPVDRPAAKIR